MTWPFANNTEKIEWKLARRSLAADRRRNLVAVFTIALAVCLMGLCAFLHTAQQQRALAHIRGQYQSGCTGLSYEGIERLVATGKLERWGYQSSPHDIRYLDTNLSVKFFDAGMLELMQVDPITGVYPVQKHEICVERAFLEYIKIPEETGQTICLNLGDGEQEYVISGILEKENTSRVFDVYVSEALAVAQGGETPFDILFRFAGSSTSEPERLRVDIRAFYEEMGIPENMYFFSSNYFDMTELYLSSDLPVYGVALLIAIVCAVVIYNIFYISVMGKLREYGRLKVIGTTPRQLRSVVRCERVVLMCMSIPAGLLAAAALCALLDSDDWNWVKNLQYAVFIAVVTVLMVIIATRKPMLLAGRVSAIDAVRGNVYQAVSGGSRVLHRRLSVFRLAGLNFARSRRKMILTLVSLGMTGILTACIASYANSVNAEEMARNSFGDGGDYAVEIYDPECLAEKQREGALDAEKRAQLLALPDIDGIHSWSAFFCTVAQSPNPTDWYAAGGLTREQMALYQERDLVKDGVADYDALLENNGILVTRDSENLMKLLHHMDLSVGDTVTLQSTEGITKDYTVMGFADYVHGMGTYKEFVLPEEELHRLYSDIEDFTNYICIHAKHVSDTQRRAIYALLDDPSMELSTLEDATAFAKDQLDKMILMMYGAVCFIGLFALINLMNTLMTNLLARQQEFGILQSVGMTGRQLSRMISAECLCYVGVTILITFFVGGACGFAAVRLFNQFGLFGKLTYHYPVAPLLIFAVALLAVYGVFSLTAVRYVQRQPLVERIKVIE
ncbi:MAG: ABC transporter permease [Lachnospiraceae bacterium]|nr:ABC transporter permease [Lachnospiraceae bacterium]